MNSGGLVKADRSDFGPFWAIFQEYSWACGSSRASLLQGIIWCNCGVCFSWFGILSGNAPILKETKSGRGFELAGKAQNVLLLRKLFGEPEQLPEDASSPFQMCCTSGADSWMSWSCPSSLVNPSQVEPARPLEIRTGGCKKQCR